MGLDMHLTKRLYVGGNYSHRNVRGEINLFLNEKNVTIPLDKVTEIILDAGYWRKANQIHNWFVKNVQGGIDDCKEHHVPYEMLINLKDLCKEIVIKKDKALSEKLLPPTEGFFFGDTEIDEFYYDNISITLEILEDMSEDYEYYYKSSW